MSSNFARSAEQLAALYQKADATAQIQFSAGSSGKLYAQVEHGAPFDFFLSADSERPEMLEQKGLAVAGSRFTYAYGRRWIGTRAPDDRNRGGRAAAVRPGS